MKVVITGATGNVGTSLLSALEVEPEVEQIVGLARRKPDRWTPEKTEWISADVVWSDLDPALDGAGAVVHLAWAIQPGHSEIALESINLEGSRRTFEAVARMKVPKLLYASSIGVYGAGSVQGPVSETFPRTPIETSFYSRHKVAVEEMLDRFEEEHPEVDVVRLRPALIFKREAASGIRRLFAGPFLPSPMLRPRLIPFLPEIKGLRFQAVHSDDVADAFRRALVGDVRGAFNIAAEPSMTLSDVAKLFGARTFPISPQVARRLVEVTWHGRLQPTGPGWLDMGMEVPLMDSGKAESELGWKPRHSATAALGELIEGIRDGEGIATPPLAPSSLRGRAAEVLTGVGGRLPTGLPDRRLVSYIADVHSIEEQALTQMRRAPEIAKEAHLAEAFTKHEAETRDHERLIRGRLQAHSTEPSKLKDVPGKAGGAAMLLFAISQPDSPGKLTAHAYSYEHMEIAAYRLLERVSDEAGDGGTADVARRILGQERAMADRLSSLFDAAVDASLGGPSGANGQRHLDSYLDDAHAIEMQATVVLAAARRFVGDPTLVAALSDRGEQVKLRRSQIEDRLKVRGSEISPAKDLTLAAGGLGIGGFFGVQPDRGLKIVGFLYAFEHLKVAAYELLARVADRVGDTNTRELAKPISREADLMAERLDQWMGRVPV